MYMVSMRTSYVNVFFKNTILSYIFCFLVLPICKKKKINWTIELKIHVVIVYGFNDLKTCEFVTEIYKNNSLYTHTVDDR